MGEHIWIVRDPSGTVIGAGTRPVSAVCEMERAEQHNPAFLTLFGALERSYPDWVIRYEANGYTLTREPLPTGTAGVGDDTRLLDALEDEKLLTGSFYPFDGVWRIEMHGDEYEGPTLRDAIRAALAASTRTGEDDHPTTPTRGSDD